MTNRNMHYFGFACASKYRTSLTFRIRSRNANNSGNNTSPGIPFHRGTRIPFCGYSRSEHCLSSTKITFANNSDSGILGAHSRATFKMSLVNSCECGCPMGIHSSRQYRSEMFTPLNSQILSTITFPYFATAAE